MSQTIATALWELRQLYKEVSDDNSSPETKNEFTDHCYSSVPLLLNEVDYMYSMLTTTNSSYTQNIINGKTFSFRAECAYDVDALRHNLIAARKVFTLDAGPNPLLINGELVPVPDVVATLVIDMSLDDLRRFMRTQEDSHVMVQTLRECPLEQNSLERDWSQ